MNRRKWLIYAWVIFTMLATSVKAQVAPEVTVWLTKADRSELFKKQEQHLKFTATAGQATTITVNDNKTYQSIDGFGFALTGGSAGHIIRMNPASRADLLKNLFAVNDGNIGISYLHFGEG